VRMANAGPACKAEVEIGRTLGRHRRGRRSAGPRSPVIARSEATRQSPPRHATARTSRPLARNDTNIRVEPLLHPIARGNRRRRRPERRVSPFTRRLACLAASRTGPSMMRPPARKRSSRLPNLAGDLLAAQPQRMLESACAATTSGCAMPCVHLGPGRSLVLTILHPCSRILSLPPGRSRFLRPCIEQPGQRHRRRTSNRAAGQLAKLQ